MKVKYLISLDNRGLAPREAHHLQAGDAFCVRAAGLDAPRLKGRTSTHVGGLGARGHLVCELLPGGAVRTDAADGLTRRHLACHGG